ncbi:MAG: Double zinc ribbon [Solirubrobacteraceae bacterium]|nr:Double zinc ribbon [Solirubrobacteraceae bacterium]
MTLAPVPSEQPDATCANCGAAVVADQRYCLSCGQPVSPVRLAFLDVLAPSSPAPTGSAPAAWAGPATIEAAPAGFVTYQPQQGPNAWLRRNSGLLGLLAILGLFLLAGLLVGHWVSQSKSPANTTVKIEGLGGLAAAGSGGAAATSTTPAESGSSTPAAAKSSSKQEAKEAAEGAHETKAEKAPPKAPKKVSSGTLQKLTQSKGKKHQEEINALGAEPIETG